MEKITNIYRTSKDKNGSPLKTRDGREYTRISIKTQEHGVKWISGFENYQNANWKEGDVVDIEVTTNGEYLNFKSLSKLDLLERRVEALEKLINKPNDKPQNDDEPPTEDYN